ncbi:MAG: hypothetical protein A3K10_11345 [Bacteroidetes bacterium RIFCSPLOWO2_12_FULL_31_6]|nr:MAG: hypothetical protein A3K10_11345 [Bacteroidetes bacterium RIFCSPLOWO2_12_FULL_31_6]
MKNKTDNLFLLIKSLTKSEKRYFKVNTLSASKDNSNYNRLFDIIDKQEVFDEKMLIKCFKNNKNFNYSFAKNYLLNTIIKSLYNFSSINTPEAKINNCIDLAEVLETKQLYNLSIKYINKAKQLCYENELYAQIIRALQLEIRISGKLFPPASSTTSELEKEFNSALDTLKNNYDYYFLEIKLNECLKNSTAHNNDEKINDLFKNKLLSDLSEAISPVAKLRYNRIKGIQFYLNGDFTNFYETQKFIIKQYEKNTVDIKSNPIKYCRLLFDYLTACSYLEKYDEIISYLTVLHELSQSKISGEHKNIITGYYFIVLTDVCFKIGLPDYIVEYISSNKEFIAELLSALTPNLQSLLLFHLVRLNYFANDLKTALHYTQFLQNIADIRFDIHIAFLTVQIFIHVRKCDVDLTISFIRKSIYLIKEQSSDLTAYSELIYLLEKVIKNLDYKSKEKDVVKGLTNKINSITPSDTLYHFIQLTGIKIWAEALMNNISTTEQYYNTINKQITLLKVPSFIVIAK